MSKTAVLLANLGSPDSYQVKDLKKYLNEFLMDGRVIDIPYPIRFLLVKGIIVPFRSPKSAEKYKTIWTENGSPLIHISKQVQQGLHHRMNLPVALCMRYGNPTPEAAFENLVKSNPDLEEVVMVPLYPHYAMSSYETAVEHVKETYKQKGYRFQLRIVPPYYKHPKYIAALASSIRPFLEKTFDHLLFSYHGVPERHMKKGDSTRSHCLIKENCCSVDSSVHAVCYRHQVIETTKLVAKELGLTESQFSFSFQSRLGADQWLKPYTAKQLEEFPKKGIKNLLVVCPAFVSDCLETLEEIQVEGQEIFEEHGGEHYRVIPCLNDRSDWIETVAQLVTETCKAQEPIVI